MSISLRTEKLKGEPSHPIEDEEKKKPQDLAVASIFERFTEIFAKSQRDVHQLSNIIHLKKDQEERFSLQNIKALCDFLNISSYPKLSEQEFKLLVDVASENRALGKYITIFKGFYLELFLSMKEMQQFLGATEGEEAFKKALNHDLFLFFTQLPTYLSLEPKEGSKLKNRLILEYDFLGKESRFTHLVQQNKVSKLKSSKSKSDILEKKDKILKKHQDLLTLFEKLLKFDEEKVLLGSFLEVIGHKPFENSLEAKKQDLKRVKAYVEFLCVCESYLERGEDFIGFDGEYKEFLKEIILFIGSEKQVDKKHKESFFILDWIEKKITQLSLTPQQIESEKTPVNELLYIFEILYQITSPSQIEEDFSFQALCKRSFFLTRVWLIDGYEWVQRTRGLSRSLTPFETFRLKTICSYDALVKKLQAYDETSKNGLSMFYGRAEGKILHESLKKELPLILSQLKDLTFENLDIFSRETFLKEHIWLIQLLLIEHDLGASCACEVPKNLEEVLEPILQLCEKALVSKAENDKELFDALVEEEDPAEIESPKSCEVEEICATFKESVSLKEEKKEAQPLNKKRIEKATSVTLEKKKSRKITAQDLLNLKGKNIRLIFRLLEEGGFERKRSAKGSHEIWGAKDQSDKKAVIPKHDTIKPGTLKSIADQLGLSPK